MLKNLIIFMLTIGLIFSIFTIKNQSEFERELKEKVDIASSIIMKANNERTNLYYSEIDMAKRFFDQPRQEKLFGIAGLQNALNALKRLNNTEELLINKELEEIPNFLKPTLDLVQSNSKDTSLQKIIKFINLSKAIKKIIIPLNDYAFYPEDYIISHNLKRFQVKQNENLSIPIKLQSLNYKGKGIYSLIDTLNFHKMDDYHGEFIFPKIPYQSSQTNIYSKTLKYFIKNELNGEVVLEKKQDIEIEILK